MSADTAAGAAQAQERLSAPTRVTCPTDDWTFDARYTDGVCPLCGWRPPGFAAELPWSARVDWFLPTAAGVVLVSVVMAILVLVAYSKG